MKKVIESFVPQGGKHCITNALKQIFCYYGHPVSEEMLFGLASGLSFLYINQSAAPMINGRTKVFEFEKKLAERLNIQIKCRSVKDYTKAFDTAKQMIGRDDPVLIYADMPYLKYLGMDEDSHFGGHAVVIFGYDDSAEQFLVSDRDNHDFPIRIPNGFSSEDYHLVSYEEMKEARSSSYRPFPANNKFLTFDFAGYKEIDSGVLKEAIMETCSNMLNPPARLLGLNGIMKFSKEILKWERFTPEKLCKSGVTNYFQISRDGGTGGGIFRKMYGEFLIEAAAFMNQKSLSVFGQQFLDAADKWDEIAEDMWNLSLSGNPELLKKMSASAKELCEIEKQLYEGLKFRLMS